MNNHKIPLALVVVGIVVAVALAPMLLTSALAVKEQTCTHRGGS
jgi:multisubunit Na+/H+ antiporter MnhC subunit